MIKVEEHWFDTGEATQVCFVKYADWEKLKNALVKINTTLSIPAAEYVPAIGDVFDIIDEALGFSPTETLSKESK